MKINACLPSASRRDGFTLIELLVVISIIALLIAILLPALGAAKKSAQMVNCLSNMKQWGIAQTVYSTENRGYLPRTGNGGQNTLDGTWYNELPPLIDYEEYGEVFPGTAVDINLVYDKASIWFCPSRASEGNFLSSSQKNGFHYGMNTVLNGTGSLGPTTATYITTGNVPAASSTVFLSEPFNNQPYVVPNSGVGATSGGNIEWDRHASTKVNILFLDSHCSTFESKTGVNEIDTDTPYYANSDLGIVWGPF